MTAFCLTAAAFTAGCGDSDSSKDDEICKEGVMRCSADDSAVEVCKDNQWSAATPCGNNKTCQKVGDAFVCQDKPAAEEDPCKDKTENAACGDNKTCQKVGDALVCQDKPVAEEDPCKDKTENAVCGDNKTCQKVGDALVCQDKPAESESCTAENTRCSGDGKSMETCIDGKWVSQNCGHAEDGAEKSCFVLNGAAACGDACPTGAAEGAQAPVCAMEGDTHIALTYACQKDDAGRLYRELEARIPCMDACAEGKCDIDNPCEGKGTVDYACHMLNGRGYMAACEDNRVIHEMQKCGYNADGTPKIFGTMADGLVCIGGANSTTCGCETHEDCFEGFRCVALGSNPEFPEQGGYCEKSDE